MTINDYIGKLSPEEKVDAFVIVLDALSDESLAVALGELTFDERERLREALDAEDTDV